MSRQRVIKPGWLRDEKLAGLSDGARIMSLALIMQADDHGRGEAHADALADAFSLHPDAHERGQRAFAEVCASGFAVAYRVGARLYYFLPKWKKHQKVNHPGKARFPAPNQGKRSKVLCENNGVFSMLCNDPLEDSLEDSLEENVHETPQTGVRRIRKRKVLAAESPMLPGICGNPLEDSLEPSLENLETRGFSLGAVLAPKELKRGSKKGKITEPHLRETPNGVLSTRRKTRVDAIGVVRRVFAHWVQVHTKAETTKLTPQRIAKVRARLREGYTEQDLCAAIDGCLRSKFHMGSNPDGKFWNDLTLICRDGVKVEMFRDMAVAGSRLAPGARQWLNPANYRPELHGPPTDPALFDKWNDYCDAAQ